MKANSKNAEPPFLARRHYIFAVLALSGFVVSGCTTSHDQTALVIEQAQVPDVSMAGVCSIPVDRTDHFLGYGTLDVAFDHVFGYQLYPYIVNYLPALATSPGTTGEPNRVDIESFQVELHPQPGLTLSDPNCPLSYDSAVTGTTDIYPAGHATVAVTALQPCHALQIRDLFSSGAIAPDPVVVRAAIRAKARHGSSTFLTDEFDFPVHVCYGCLQQGFTMAGFEPYSFKNIPSCSDLASNPYTGNPCGFAQDSGPVLCCAVGGDKNKVECPGIPSAAATP